jgi:hypothetical protein
MREDLRKRAEAQISQLKKQAPSEGAPLEIKNSEESFFPQISPDGRKMVFLSKNDAGKRSAVILQRPSLDIPFDDSQRFAKVDQKMEDVVLPNLPTPRGIDEDDSPPAGSIQRISWFSNSSKFVFDQVQELNRFHEVSDLDSLHKDYVYKMIPH